jgi:hypothetical protein
MNTGVAAFQLQASGHTSLLPIATSTLEVPAQHDARICLACGYTTCSIVLPILNPAIEGVQGAFRKVPVPQTYLWDHPSHDTKVGKDPGKAQLQGMTRTQLRTHEMHDTDTGHGTRPTGLEVA